MSRNGSELGTGDDRSGLPLADIRVVETGRFAAAPACATVLADWGAEVIKLEPPGGDPARGRGLIGGVSQPGSQNPRFALHNRSRRIVTPDLRLA